jgi:RIMS-binding protein 2
VIPRQVTVRTKSRDSLSSDSVPIPIPAQVLRLKRHSIPNQNSLPSRRGARQHPHPSMLEGEESFSDREVAGFHMPMPSIGSLNIKNRLKNSFNLMRNHDIPEISKDTDRHGRSANIREFGARGPQQGPDPRGRQAPIDRPRGYPPQHPQAPPQHLRSKQHVPEYDRGRPPRPTPGMGPRPPAEVRHRLFVALFDYDPPSMSPNPDACDEELPFREGQLIKVNY